MDEFQMKQLCLDTAKAATELYDLIEKEGLTAPIDNMDNIQQLVALLEPTREIKDYYYQRNIQRMLALGISPENLLKMGGERDV